MDVSNTSIGYCYSINDLPDEVLEYILSLLPPYKDLENCTMVCKRWKKNVSNVAHHRKHKMFRSLINFDVRWECVMPLEKIQTITKRYSHSACFHENFMYVFGGCTCTSTTFNDLWKLDLSTRQWSRLLTMGSYPSPKACTTLLYHDGHLLLFGGWTHPSPYPLHQAWKTFSELHMYDIMTNRWCSITTPTASPPPMAGHSATIHKDNMVIFGGLHGQSGSSNDIWCFNLSTHSWTQPIVSGVKPQSRYGQSQIMLDDNHLLILGGCGGGNMNLNDVWLLKMSDAIWTWRQATVRNPQWAASHLWCHPACRVGEFVVVFSRNPVSVSPMHTYSKWRPHVHSMSQSSISERDPTIPIAVRRASESMVEPPVIDRDVNVNGRRGSLNVRVPPQPQQQQQSESSASVPSGGASSLSSSSRAKSVALPSDISVSNEKLNCVEGNIPSTSKSSKIQSTHRDSKISVEQKCDLSNDKINYNVLRTTSNNSSCSTSSGHEGSSLYSERFANNLALHNRRLEHLTSLSLTGLAAFRDTSQVKQVNKQRERQLEALNRIEERLRSKTRERCPDNSNRPSSSSSRDSLCSSSSSSSSTTSSHVRKETVQTQTHTTVKNLTPKMAMFILDISCVLSEECIVTWLPIKSVAEDSPDDMILYTLVPGNGELVMFGGIQKDAMSINQQAQSSANITNIVSNSLYFISPPRTVI